MKKIDYKNLFNVKNKNVIVVGGLGLIGKEVVDAFSSFGSNVFILDYNLSLYKKNQKKLKKKRNIQFEFFDLKDETHIKNNFPIILKKIKKLDIFINLSYAHTGDWSKNNFKQASYDNLKKNTEYQLVTTAWLSKCVANFMLKTKVQGSIINFGSIYGVVGQNLNIYKKTNMRENITYSMVKGGIINLTKQMASYYGRYNIRINCISPGGLLGQVAGFSNSQNKNFLKHYSNQVPMKRLGSPKEICGATLFLGSQSSSYVTGTNLIVDGGWTSI